MRRGNPNSIFMRQPKPFVLISAVSACAVVLLLHRFGLAGRALTMWQTLAARLLPSGTVPAGAAWQMGYHTVLAFVAAAVCAGLPRRSLGAAFLAALMFLTVTLAAVLALKGIVFEPASGILAALLAGLGGLTLAGSERGGRLHAFRDFFVNRVSSDRFEKLLVNREPIRLSGTREVSTLRCRILNLADLTHRLEVVDIELLTSAFQKQAGEFLIQQGGYLDVSNSQGLTVQFGFPLRDAAHAELACRAAAGLRTVVEKFVAESEKRWEQRPKIGIAVASGPVVCGLIGYSPFQAYSVMGGPVETSAALCQDPTGVVVSGTTHLALPEALKGKKLGEDKFDLPKLVAEA